MRSQGGADVLLYRFEDPAWQNGPVSMFIPDQPLPAEGKAQGPSSSGIQREATGCSSIYGLVDGDQKNVVTAEAVPCSRM